MQMSPRLFAFLVLALIVLFVLANLLMPTAVPYAPGQLHHLAL
jgi:hypothetical protein